MDEALPDEPFIIPLGQSQIHEIRIPYFSGNSRSRFSVDWILAHCDAERRLIDFVAVEVQSIDTTGNYQSAYQSILKKHHPEQYKEVVRQVGAKPTKAANFNWENVNKRILPQIISKGHVLRREVKCTKGMFFMLPLQVMEKIFERVGALQEYPLQTGTVTFLGYECTKYRDLRLERTFTTTIDQLALAFSAPGNLPEAGVYEEKIVQALQERFG